jgi:glutamine synthetase
MYSRSWSHYFSENSVGLPSFTTEYGLWDDRQAAAAEQVEAGLDEIDQVRLVFCDPHGLARSKVLPVESFRVVLRNGMDFSPGPFLFDTGHAVAIGFLDEDPDVRVGELTGAGDFLVVPDPTTFQVLPGAGPRTAWVLGDEFLRDGSPHPLSSRHVLRRVAARFAEHHLMPVVGLEVEWYLTRLLGGPVGNVGNGFGQQGAAPEVEPVNAGYQFNLDSYFESIAPVANPLSMMLRELGLPLRSMEHESGPGQVETTFGPMGALDAADAMLLFRALAKQTCARLGFHASFMALPGIAGFDPSGWHLHQSVMSTKTGRNVFTAEDAAEGLSPEGKAYADGVMARAREFCLLSVPTVNGYRRLTPGFVLSPTRVNLSFEDRSAMVRVLGHGGSTHIENRTGEPSANPYLMIASQMFAGLDGLTGNLPPERPPTGDFASAEVGTLPQSLPEALDAFRAGGRVQDLLGTPLASCLAKLKESEASRHAAWLAENEVRDGDVSEWEHREYFGAY